MKKFKRIIERIIESTLFLCGSITGIIILLIIIFLFKEGSGLFNKKIIEDDYVLAINNENNIKSLSSQEIKRIFDSEITNWRQIGGKDLEILPFRMNDIGNYCSDEEIGEEMEKIDKCINKIVKENTNIIAFIPKIYVINHRTDKPNKTKTATYKQYPFLPIAICSKCST